jgi:hypothetical protein
LGLPRDLLSMGFHFIIVLTFLLSSILFTWPYHANRWDFLNRIIYFFFHKCFYFLICSYLFWFLDWSIYTSQYFPFKNFSFSLCVIIIIQVSLP